MEFFNIIVFYRILRNTPRTYIESLETCSVMFDARLHSITVERPASCHLVYRRF